MGLPRSHSGANDKPRKPSTQPIIPAKRKSESTTQASTKRLGRSPTVKPVKAILSTAQLKDWAVTYTDYMTHDPLVGDNGIYMTTVKQGPDSLEDALEEIQHIYNMDFPEWDPEDEDQEGLASIVVGWVHGHALSSNDVIAGNARNPNGIGLVGTNVPTNAKTWPTNELIPVIVPRIEKGKERKLVYLAAIRDSYGNFTGYTVPKGTVFYRFRYRKTISDRIGKIRTELKKLVVDDAMYIEKEAPSREVIPETGCNDLVEFLTKKPTPGDTTCADFLEKLMKRVGYKPEEKPLFLGLIDQKLSQKDAGLLRELI